MIPKDIEVRRKIISYMLDGLLRSSIENEWENEFVHGVSEQFEKRQNLSDKQCEILERIYNKVL